MYANRDYKLSLTALQLNYLFKCSYLNIVYLKEAYFNKSLLFVYKGSSVSLLEI